MRFYLLIARRELYAVSPIVIFICRWKLDTQEITQFPSSLVNLTYQSWGQQSYFILLDLLRYARNVTEFTNIIECYKF